MMQFRGGDLKPTQIIYEGVNEVVFSFVPTSAKRILDVGCGTGMLGARLRSVRERTVIGITYSHTEAERARSRLSDVVCADINNLDIASLGKFDCVVLSHILEHLYAPEALLEQLKSSLTQDAVIVVALPNVLWYRQRIQFMLGKWRYQDWGVLDRTHFRFFDRKSARALVENAGFEIMQMRDDGPFPLTRPVRKLLGPVAAKIDLRLCRFAPGLLAVQCVYLARVK
jgi:2-polyprenyl-3-methyl-5-hydroxy-6-metoxy-1,4-benzoquinol methylase